MGVNSTEKVGPGGFRLDGQIIAVTEAESGYGCSITLRLAERGARVVVISRNAAAASRLASHIEDHGGSAIPIKVDLVSSNEWEQAQSKILEIFGTLHGVVHLANQGQASGLAKLNDAEWRDLVESDLSTSLWIAQAIRRHLPETWLTLVAPAASHASLPVHLLRSALQALASHATSENLRVNLLIPTHDSAGEEADRAVSEVALTLAYPALHHLRGNSIVIPQEEPKGGERSPEPGRFRSARAQ